MHGRKKQKYELKRDPSPHRLHDGFVMNWSYPTRNSIKAQFNNVKHFMSQIKCKSVWAKNFAH